MKKQHILVNNKLPYSIDGSLLSLTPSLPPSLTPSLPPCCGYWCFPCLCCSVASDMDECCLCGSSMDMRTMYRTKHNIRMSFLCGDFCAILWCQLCSTCQLKRDIDLRKEQGIF
uniref:Placenta-specific gene 8 protein n=1 Tax=Oncorhynchus kisutch TaxID=8019 RepID=A0A8C7DQ26_ONCKI